MAKSLKDKFGLHKVTIFQSRSRARVVIEVAGDVDVTGPKIKELIDLLSP